MDTIQLKAQKRTVTGRKVKKLRSEGLVPANIYGNKVKSQAVSVDAIEFIKTFKKAGETQIVELQLDNETRPVLIHNLQKDPLTGKPIHADFYQVNLKEKIKTNVPVELVGESPAVVQKIGLLLQTLNEVEVEALPTDLPEKLTIDVVSLKAVGDELKVSDIKVPQGVEIFDDKEIGIVKVGELVSKEVEEMAKEEEAAAAEAKAAAGEEEAEEGEGEEKKPEAEKGKEEKPVEGEKEAEKEPQEKTAKE